MSSTLEDIQDAVAEQLKQRAFIADREIRVFDRKASELESEIDWLIGEGVGIAVFVPYPFPEKLNPDNPNLSCEKISVQVRVVEKVGTNETGISALRLAEYILRAMHWWELPEIEGVNPGSIISAEETPLVDESGEWGTNIILINFFTSGTMGSLLNTEPDENDDQEED